MKLRQARTILSAVTAFVNNSVSTTAVVVYDFSFIYRVFGIFEIIRRYISGQFHLGWPDALFPQQIGGDVGNYFVHPIGKRHRFFKPEYFRFRTYAISEAETGKDASFSGRDKKITPACFGGGRGVT